MLYEVITPEDHKAILVAMEKGEKGWNPVFEPVLAGVGKNGFAPQNP